MTVASRTPEGEPFACRVCGAVDRVEMSAPGADAVCPRCGGYLTSVLAAFDELFGSPGPVTLDTDMETFLGYDSPDIAERVEKLGRDVGGRVDWEAFQRCRTVEDLVRYLVSLRTGNSDP